MKLQSTVSCTGIIDNVNRYLFISNRIIEQKYMPLIHNLINNVVHFGVTTKNKCRVSVQTISIYLCSRYPGREIKNNSCLQFTRLFNVYSTNRGSASPTRPQSVGGNYSPANALKPQFVHTS